MRPVQVLLAHFVQQAWLNGDSLIFALQAYISFSSLVERNYVAATNEMKMNAKSIRKNLEEKKFNNNNYNTTPPRHQQHDVLMLSERNTSVKVMGKLSKFKDLEVEISRIQETGTTPVLFDAQGLVKKG